MAAGGLEQGLNTAVTAAPLMIAPRAIIKCFEAACSGKSFREGLQVEQEQFTQLVFSVESKVGLLRARVLGAHGRKTAGT